MTYEYHPHAISHEQQLTFGVVLLGLKVEVEEMVKVYGSVVEPKFKATNSDRNYKTWRNEMLRRRYFGHVTHRDRDSDSIQSGVFQQRGSYHTNALGSPESASAALI